MAMRPRTWNSAAGAFDRALANWSASLSRSRTGRWCPCSKSSGAVFFRSFSMNSLMASARTVSACLASSAACTFSRASRPRRNANVATARARIRASATVPAAMATRLFRRTSFLKRYSVLGGRATTGSSRRKRPRSSASALADSYRRGRVFFLQLLKSQDGAAGRRLFHFLGAAGGAPAGAWASFRREGPQSRARAQRLALADCPPHLVQARTEQLAGVERRPADQQLIEQDAQAVDVAARVHVQPAHLRLFGADVSRRADELLE